ncbi:hypothetical protein AYO40_04370 [Planctomycetaceae bacterium SCGC AG-212-D15]|nr:hypothetical protein AYO40_04370 [Planctomycetaceae bacterium SCGC AG-212-D15]
MTADHGSKPTACRRREPAVDSNRHLTPSLLLCSAVERWLRTPSADYPAVVDLAFQRGWRRDLLRDDAP